jgi:hypothetical protein
MGQAWHGSLQFTPSTSYTSYDIISSKKDAVDIDKFTEYIKLIQNIFEEEPSKLFVYLSLEDVKMNAKVPSHHKYIYYLQVTYYFLATGAWS